MGLMEIKKYLERTEKYFKGFNKARWEAVRKERYVELKSEIDENVKKGSSFNDAAIDVLLKRVVDADAAVWIIKDLLKKLEEK